MTSSTSFRKACPQLRSELVRVVGLSSSDVLFRGRPGVFRGDRGATSVEYALMVSLIAVVIIGSVTAFGINVIDLFHVPSSAL